MAGTPLPCEQWFLYEGPERDHCERPFASLIEPLSSAMDEYIKQVKALGHLLTLLTAAATQACWEFAFFNLFMFSIKRKITHFYVVVVQKRQRNVQKRVMHMQSCCFAH